MRLSMLSLLSLAGAITTGSAQLPAPLMEKALKGKVRSMPGTTERFGNNNKMTQNDSE